LRFPEIKVYSGMILIPQSLYYILQRVSVDSMHDFRKQKQLRMNTGETDTQSVRDNFLNLGV
jgi:hypothetical protein